MNTLTQPTSHALTRSPDIKYERIPSDTERQRNAHQTTRRAQGWDASYQWEGNDGHRDLYHITLTKLEF